MSHAAEPPQPPFGPLEIAISGTNAERIDKLVDDYEASILLHVDSEYDRQTTWADRLADRIAAFGGSWHFIMLFGAVLGTWIAWNTLPLTRPWHFDPQPYILLNLCLSFVAAFQAPVILMSQNRQAARDKRESIVDFAVNYRAALEIDDLQARLARIEALLERQAGRS